MIAAQEAAKEEAEKAADMIKYEEGTPAEVKLLASDGNECGF